jgi:hypothetical protein
LRKDVLKLYTHIAGEAPQAAKQRLFAVNSKPAAGKKACRYEP